MRHLTIACFVLCAAASHAVVLINQDPGTGPNGGSWSNTTGAQILGDSFTPTANWSITGYDYYSSNSSAGGNSWTLTLYSDNAGVPGTVLQTLPTLSYSSYTLWGNQGSTPMYQAVFDFSPISVTQGVTYWMTMSANGFEGALASTNPSSNGDGFLAFESSPAGPWNRINSIGDVTYRLRGDAVPEPATMAILGLGALALARRRSRR